MNPGSPLWSPASFNYESWRWHSKAPGKLRRVQARIWTSERGVLHLAAEKACSVLQPPCALKRLELITRGVSISKPFYTSPRLCQIALNRLSGN